MTLIFCKSDETNLGSCALVLFEAMSGHSFNLSKSFLIPIGEILGLPYLAHLFECAVEYVPSPYLGLPLDANFKSKVV